jgi:hypothetical protein
MYGITQTAIMVDGGPCVYYASLTQTGVNVDNRTWHDHGAIAKARHGTHVGLRVYQADQSSTSGFHRQVLAPPSRAVAYGNQHTIEFGGMLQ